jgi:hypothetical protein
VRAANKRVRPAGFGLGLAICVRINDKLQVLLGQGGNGMQWDRATGLSFCKGDAK